LEWLAVASKSGEFFCAFSLAVIVSRSLGKSEDAAEIRSDRDQDWSVIADSHLALSSLPFPLL
jgi:hypothetical protein